MLERHPDNERIKHRYFEFLKQADGKSEQTIRQIEKAILRFEEFGSPSCYLLNPSEAQPIDGPAEPSRPGAYRRVLSEKGRTV